MKRIILLNFVLVLSIVAYSQVTYTSWNIDGISPGGEIVFNKGVAKQISIVINAQKPNNLVVGSGSIKLVTREIGGTQVISQEVVTVPESSWSPGTGTNPVYFNSSNSITYALDFTATAKLVFVTSNGTEYVSSNSINFKVNTPPPVANAGADKLIYCPGSTTLQGSASGGTPPYSYSWSPTTGLNFFTTANPLAFPTTTTRYTLTVTDSKGQKGTDDVIVNVVPDDAPSIGGNTSVYRPCPKQSARYYFSLQSVPSNATNFAWQTDFGYISKLFYTGSRATGIEITVGVAPLPEVRVATISGDYFTVTCIATYPCGNKTGTKNVNLEFPVCAFPRDPGPIRFPQQALTLEGTSSKTLAYPNPSTGTINFQFILDHPSNVSIEILDSFGRSYSKNNLGLMEEGIYSENLEINQNGNYFILLNDGNKSKLTRVLITK